MRKKNKYLKSPAFWVGGVLNLPSSSAAHSMKTYYAYLDKIKNGVLKVHAWRVSNPQVAQPSPEKRSPMWVRVQCSVEAGKSAGRKL